MYTVPLIKFIIPEIPKTTYNDVIGPSTYNVTSTCLFRQTKLSDIRYGRRHGRNECKFYQKYV